MSLRVGTIRLTGKCSAVSATFSMGTCFAAYLILRLGEEKGNLALKQPHVKPFDITGRRMKGWVMVASEGFATDNDLAGWLAQAREFAGALPAK